jgi:glycosyltransferase involved in cell wall biosynthesis
MLSSFQSITGIEFFPVEMSRSISPFRDLLSLVRLVRVFLRIRPDAINVSTPKAALLGNIAGFITGVRTRIYSVRGLVYESATGWKRILLKVCEKIACYLSHSVIAESRSVARRIMRDGLSKLDKVHVLPHGSVGIDAQNIFNPARINATDIAELKTTLRLNSSMKLIGYAGRLVKDKGIRELFEAWDRLRQSGMNIGLILVGPLETEHPLDEDFVSRLNTSPGVIMTGYVSREELPLYYSLMDVFVLPSFREGLPTVILEASAMEIPIVATRVTGCIDAVRNKCTGTLVSLGSIDELSQALKKYLETPHLCMLHGKNGRKYVLEYYQEKPIWNTLMNILMESLQGAKKQNKAIGYKTDPTEIVNTPT